MKTCLLLVAVLCPFVLVAQGSPLRLKSGTYRPRTISVEQSTYARNELVNQRYYRILQFAQVPGQEEKDRRPACPAHQLNQRTSISESLLPDRVLRSSIIEVCCAGL